jgi:predicted  nucleic acid-binding Zn-ribbon protein
MKLLRARQKKNLKQKVKEINKQAEKLYEQQDEIKTKIAEYKANVYAEQATGSTAPGLVD